MFAETDPALLRLIVVNVILGAVCALAVLVVAGAVVYELWVRRHLRKSLPDGWPPNERPARRLRMRVPERDASRR